MRKIADALGMSLEKAAEGIVNIVNENMCGALRLVSVEQGYDPRDFALIAFGGAGPLHANALAQAHQFLAGHRAARARACCAPMATRRRGCATRRSRTLVQRFETLTDAQVGGDPRRPRSGGAQGACRRGRRSRGPGDDLSDRHALRGPGHEADGRHDAGRVSSRAGSPASRSASTRCTSSSSPSRSTRATSSSACAPSCSGRRSRSSAPTSGAAAPDPKAAAIAAQTASTSATAGARRRSTTAPSSRPAIASRGRRSSSRWTRRR